ncbi:hypothetical protein FOZ60_002174 [Perkinsus olseni]|uniref:Uncharacterized protein n=1 Tax=Perkinsus olseni TaxID=32597 RepID=A0A7J6NYM0_PEROL|nr:hypothetical protein FOZ60_002174 [Perkinsus olseni]
MFLPGLRQQLSPQLYPYTGYHLPGRRGAAREEEEEEGVGNLTSLEIDVKQNGNGSAVGGKLKMSSSAGDYDRILSMSSYCDLQPLGRIQIMQPANLAFRRCLRFLPVDRVQGKELDELLKALYDGFNLFPEKSMKVRMRVAICLANASWVLFLGRKVVVSRRSVELVLPVELEYSAPSDPTRPVVASANQPLQGASRIPLVLNHLLLPRPGLMESVGPVGKVDGVSLNITKISLDEARAQLDLHHLSIEPIVPTRNVPHIKYTKPGGTLPLYVASLSLPPLPLVYRRVEQKLPGLDTKGFWQLDTSLDAGTLQASVAAAARVFNLAGLYANSIVLSYVNSWHLQLGSTSIGVRYAENGFSEIVQQTAHQLSHIERDSSAEQDEGPPSKMPRLDTQ